MQRSKFVSSILFLIASATVAEGVAVAAFYDENHVLPMCADGPADYMKNCVYQSDLFNYFRSEKPYLDTVFNCTERGYEYVSQDATFTHPDYKIYWKGGFKAYSEYMGTFSQTHPDFVKKLRFARDQVPGCKLGDEPAPTTESNAELVADDSNETLAFYDADVDNTVFGQCAEASASYMKNCLEVSDLLSYFVMNKPTVVKGTCKDLGDYGSVPHPPAFYGFNMFWKGGKWGVFKQLPAYLLKHTSTIPLMQKFDKANPACKWPQSLDAAVIV